MTETTSFKRLILRAVLRQVSPMVIRLVAVSDQVDLPEFHEIFHAILGWNSFARAPRLLHRGRRRHVPSGGCRQRASTAGSSDRLGRWVAGRNGEGSLIKLKGCRFWYAQYYDRNGRKIRISTQTEVKQKALAILRKQMVDRDEGLAPFAGVRKLTYKDLRSGLIANYIEKGNKSLIVRADGEETVPGLKQVDDFFKYSAENPGPSVMQISIETGPEFVRWRQAEGAGSAVINRSLACLRRMFKLAYEERKIQSLPVIRLLKEPPARRGFLELPRFEELLAQFPPNLKPYITFLYFCGGRSGEAELIEWSQVDLERKLIRIEDDQTKDKQAREIPLPQRLVLMLERIEPKQGRVFDTTNIRKEWT